MFSVIKLPCKMTIIFQNDAPESAPEAGKNINILKTGGENVPESKLVCLYSPAPAKVEHDATARGWYKGQVYEVSRRFGEYPPP